MASTTGSQHLPPTSGHYDDKHNYGMFASPLVSQQNFQEDHEHEHDDDQPKLRNRYRKDVVDVDDHNISIPASSKLVDKTVAPFLAEHIPAQYNPSHASNTLSTDHDHSHTSQQSNTKFCYRHRPDLKCRRQVNEPSMAQLQNELATLSQSDQQAISHVWSLFSAAPAKHRNLMLQGILTQCCFPQLSYIAANVRDLIKIDFLSALPPELGYQILCYLDTTSLCKAAQVSQRWRLLADDDVVWHRMCEQHIDRKCTKCGWGLPLLERKRLRIEKRQIQLRATGRGLNEWSPAITPIPDSSEEHAEEIPHSHDNVTIHDSPLGTKRSLADDLSSDDQPNKRPRVSSQDSHRKRNEDTMQVRKRPWKDIYKDRFKVGTAWKHGRCSLKVFKGHTNGVMCLQFDENVLITGSYDSTIKVWDIESGRELRTLTGHQSGIRCLQFDDTKLFTGSLDHKLRLWNWRTGQCQRIFDAHTDGVISLHFAGTWVASGSMDRTIRVWNQESKFTFLLRGHSDWVNSVKIDLPSRTLFSASDDLTVRVWDLDSKSCIRTFEGHVGQIQQVLPMPVEFELDECITGEEKDDDASSVNSSTAVNPRNARRCSPNLHEPFWIGDADRPAPPRYMLTGALDSTIRLWDVHFQPDKSQPDRSRDESNSSARRSSLVLPTDPLTNSHTPRAQACVRTFFGHVEGIWALAADHLRMVSGSEDRMMKVWDPRTGKCDRTFTGHAGPVTCAWLSDNRVASGSEDCEVRMLTFGEQERIEEC